MADDPARSASVAVALGCAALAAFVLGPTASHLGILTPFGGFVAFGAGGLLLSLAAIASGAVGLVRTRAGSGRAGRGRAQLGAILGGVTLLAVAVLGLPGRRVPAINDITTSPADPPVFVAALRDPANAGRDMSYPGDSFASQQRAAYPDLAPIEVRVPPPVALQQARRAAEELGWTVVDIDPAVGTLEANQVTRVFRFVDDVVIRVRPSGAGSRIDVRSKSRDGRGDIGANAARIRAFRAALPSAGS